MMKNIGKRLGTSTSFISQQVDFSLIDYGVDGNRRAATGIIYEDSPPGMPVAPLFSLHMETAQEFFEQLWAQGFRSQHDRGGTEKLDGARQEHIADLRKAAKLA